MRSRHFSPALLLLSVCLAAEASAAQTRWPSLAEQLAADRVPAGSALAKLIAENQEFQMLRPEETHDMVRVPPWLRVLWRKQHPEGDYSGDNPLGGYPLLIREVHEWMVGHPDLRPGEEAPSGQPPQTKAASRGADLRISGATLRPRAESDIRVNYWDPSRIIAASNNLGGGSMTVYYSHDGGATWGQSNLPLSPGDSFHSDPAVEWTSDGTAWATAIGVAMPPLVLKLRVFKSTDGGATWVEDGIISGEQNLADKQMVWTDHSERSPFKDNLYAIWDDRNIVYMNRRTGPDGAWGEPIRVSFGETRVAIGTDVKTNGAGTVFGFWPDAVNRKIRMTRSLNGGASYLPPVAIANTSDAIAIDIPAQNNRGVLRYVTGGAFQSGRKNLVYAAWTDLTGAPGCRSFTDAPRSNVASPCKTRIWFARSTNGGLRWSPARMINNPPTRNDQFNPWLVVDETTGTLGIMYYDTAGEARTKVNVWYQSSFNDGVKWSAPLKVSSEASEALGSGFQFGDYNGFSGIAGTFFPSWTDRRGTFVEEIWTAKIVDRKSFTCRTTDLFTHGVGTGSASVAVPEGAAESRLSFWHRRRFASGLNAGSLSVSVDGGPALPVPAAAILAGAGSGREEALFEGMDSSPVNTVVDLDAVCNTAAGGGAGCGGRTLRLFFSAGDLPAETPDRWLLEEVSVTACAR